MSLFGAELVSFSNFSGGLIWDVDPAEIPERAASDAANVDLYGERLVLRRGKVLYNSTAPAASRTLGLYDYYPVAGGTMIPLIAVGTAVYGDLNSDGDFADAGETLASGLSAASWYDFIGYKDAVYFGNGVDALYKWPGTGTAAAVSVLAAPNTKPAVFQALYVINNFETAWTNGPVVTNLAATPNDASSYAEAPPEGTGSTRFAASGAAGHSSYKQVWSAGTQDLSPYRWLRVKVLGHYPKMTFKIAVQDNSGALNYALWPLQTVQKGKEWQDYYIPLDPLSPDDRNASLGIGFEMGTRNPAHLSTTQSLWVDEAIPIADFKYEDAYRYRTTFYNSTSYTESPPATETVFHLGGAGVSALVVVPWYTVAAGSGVDKVFIYRQHDTGFWRLPKKVGEVNYTGALTLGAAVTTTTQTAWTVSDTSKLAVGDILYIPSEFVKISAIGGPTTLTVIRAWGGRAPSTYSNGATFRLCFVDTRSDGDVDAAAAAGGGGHGNVTVTNYTDGQELRVALIAPPKANTYCMVNHRLFAGNIVTDPVTGSGTYPWRVYVSRQGFPEEFATVYGPDDPGVAGYFDLADKSPIVRILEFDGMALIFTRSSVYSVEGSGFDDYVVTPRAKVGLVAREAVVAAGRFIYFLAEDGVRVLSPNAGADREFPCWLLSEPVRSKLQAIPTAYRLNAAMGVDDLGRIHLSLTEAGGTTNTAALVFDPRVQGALPPGNNPLRPGWTWYTGWGFTCARTTRSGAGGQAGGMLVGDPTTGKLWRMGIDAAGADLAPESGGVSWYWQSKALDAGAGQARGVAYLAAQFGPSGGQKARLTAVLDEGAIVDAEGDFGRVVTAPSSGSNRKEQRMPANCRGTRVQLRIDSATGTEGTAGTLAAHTAAFTVRSLGLGVLGAVMR